MQPGTRDECGQALHELQRRHHEAYEKLLADKANLDRETRVNINFHKVPHVDVDDEIKRLEFALIEERYVTGNTGAPDWRRVFESICPPR